MRKHLLILGLALLSCVFHSLAYFSVPAKDLEMTFLDAWFNLRHAYYQSKGHIPIPKDVVIVAMDEYSYETIGVPRTSPWPRKLHAELIRKLRDLGAKRVLFDVLFYDPGLVPEDDLNLADAMKSMPVVIASEDDLRDTGSVVVQQVMLPYELFQQSVADIALAGLPERNGYVRNFLTHRSKVASEMPSLSEAGAEAFISNYERPDYNDFINYYGPAGTIPFQSESVIIQGDLPEEKARELFKDKIVYVGFMMRTGTGSEQKDSYRTPFQLAGNTFGVEIHATAAGNLIEKSWIRRADEDTEAIALGVLTFVFSAAIYFMRPITGGPVLFGLIFLWGATAFTGFLNHQFLPGALLFVVILPLNFLFSTLYYYFVTSQRQKQVQRAFEFYVSPEMARSMASNPEALKPGGEKTMATALFTDIAGFTDISEAMEAEGVANMLNAYFTEVMEAVFQKQGTLIKFIGDAVFVLWGAPIPIPDHSQKACETALLIQREVARFNSSGRFPELHTRIGINTGPMVVGNLGSVRRFDFTAIGDSVNLASRVEGINKYFGTSIMVTDAAWENTDKSFHAVYMGAIKVVGKKQAIGLRALFEEPVPAEGVSAWNEAFEKFKVKEWDEAMELFVRAGRDEPRLKKAAALYMSQIENNRKKPPADDWQGEIIFSSK